MSSLIEDRRSWWPGVLLRGPGALRTISAKTVVTLLIVAGGALVVVSGVIHLYLWGRQDGYANIPTIGPLFLMQGIVSILVGVLAMITRWLVVALAGAGMMIASVVALMLSIHVGLFGFRDSWTAPYAKTSLYVELAAAVLLLVATGVLAWSWWGKASATRR
jgi:hypothetical protein